MKKLVVLIAVVAMFSMSANAQDAFKKGTNLLKLSIGFNEDGKPLAIAYERGIADGLFGIKKLNLGFGPYVGYYGYDQTVTGVSTITNKVKILSAGLGLYMHYQLVSKLDAYVGATAGGYLRYAKNNNTTDTGGDFAWGVIGGLRYEITSKWGIYVEGGKASGKLTLGAAYKF